MSDVIVQTAAGEIALRRPTEAEVVELEEARRYMAAPVKGALVGRDDGTEPIIRCVTNLAPDAARATLRKFPGLVKMRLVAAFREAGGDDAAQLTDDGDILAAQTSVMRDEAAVTIEQRKNWPEAIGLRCFGVALVLRPMQPERYQLMERLIAQDPLRYGVPFAEVARVGREHIVSPAKEVLDPLLAEHPYLAINLGQLLMQYAGGTESDMLGKLLRYSPASAKSGRTGVALTSLPETPAST